MANGGLDGFLCSGSVEQDCGPRVISTICMGCIRGGGSRWELSDTFLAEFQEDSFLAEFQDDTVVHYKRSKTASDE